MSELSANTVVKLTDGGTCRVKKELGRGGQGIVYLVDYKGHDYALKWYLKQNEDAFYRNLKKNCADGAPSPSFLWPEAVTEQQYDSFGYLMKLRPQGYEEIGAFMLAKARFSSIDALLDAALQICTSFQLLHQRGLSYQDMNDGNFFINPQTGHVLICDNDNVAPDKENMGILGKAGFMAPEIVSGRERPCIYTDYFSLAVTLFILFYMNRPFEGKRSLSCPCMTEELERKLNSVDAVFMMDPQNDVNRPVRGIHDNVLRRWSLYPELLRDEFIKTFSHDALENPRLRTIPKRWMEIIIQVRSLLVECPLCHKKTFVNGVSPTMCMECGKKLSKPHVLTVGHYRIPVVPGQKIYEYQTHIGGDVNKVVAEVVRNKVDPKKWGLKNFSSSDWRVTLPDGTTQKVVPPGTGMPAQSGVKIQFSKDGTGLMD